MATNKNTLKQWFENGKKPTQEQFWAWMDSYWHKNEEISISQIEELSRILNAKIDIEQLEAYQKKEEGKGLSKNDFTDEFLDLLSNALQAGNNLSDIVSAEEARVNLQLGTAAQYDVGKELDQVPTNADIEAEMSHAGHALDYDTDQDKVILKDKRGEEISAAPLPLSTVGKSGKYEDLTGKPDLSVFDNLVEAGTYDDFPPEGEKGKVYVAEDTGYIYRWAGSSGYLQLTDQTAIWGEISGDIEEQVDLKLKFDEIFLVISKLGFSLQYNPDTEKLKLLNEDNEEISETTIPSVDIDEWLSTRPKVNKFGERPELLILDEGTAKMVEVSTEGIFTDIRSFSAFVGGAIEGGTNIFRATIRNVSGISVNGLEVTVVLPESGDDITYEEPNISNPTTGTVTEVSREGNIYNYDISSLPAGKTIEISFPITWGVPGTFQASTRVKVIDPVVVDYSTGDDYSLASYRVNAKSEGVETEDCPLIEVTSNGIQVPVYSVSGTNNAIGNRIQVVSENDIILKTDIPVTFIGRYRNTTSTGARNLISRVITGKIVKVHTYRDFSDGSNPNIGVTYTPISATELKISFDPTKGITGGLVELRAGGSCNPQYVYVDCKYEIGEGLSGISSEIISIVGHSDYVISSEHSTNPQKFSFIDLDTGDQYDSVDFYELTDQSGDHITLNIPSGVSRTIELVTSDKVRLVDILSGNITSSFDSTTGKTTLEIADTASSQDNFTSERVVFNFLD